MSEVICLNSKMSRFAEDMFAEAIVDKAESVYNSFDPTRNDNVEGFMLSRWRYRCRDWIADKVKQLQKEETVNSELLNDVCSVHPEFSALAAKDEVIAILDCLASFDRRLLTLKIVHGWTFDQIAAKLHSAESTVRVKFNEALLRARWYAQQRINRGIVD